MRGWWVLYAIVWVSATVSLILDVQSSCCIAHEISVVRRTQSARSAHIHVRNSSDGDIPQVPRLYCQLRSCLKGVVDQRREGVGKLTPSVTHIAFLSPSPSSSSKSCFFSHSFNCRNTSGKVGEISTISCHCQLASITPSWKLKRSIFDSDADGLLSDCGSGEALSRRT